MRDISGDYISKSKSLGNKSPDVNGSKILGQVKPSLRILIKPLFLMKL
jgi:hypothetical protein